MEKIIYLHSIAPAKHVRFDQSLLYIAGLAKQKLGAKPANIDKLFSILEKEFVLNNKKPPSFKEVILAIDILCAINQVRISQDGNIELIQENLENAINRIKFRSSKI